MTATFTGQVDERGKLHLLNLPGWTALLKHLAGKRVILTVARPRKARSQNQNRYYFGVVVKLLAEELGYRTDEHEMVHEALKWRFLRVPAADRRLESVRSTADLSTAEFEAYLDQVRIWAAADLGIVVPLPNEVGF